MPVVRVDEISDERLRPFLRVADAELRRREGVFLAEGRLVVGRLLSNAAYGVRAVLVTDAALHALRDELVARPDVPVYVVPLAWMEPLTGFNLNRGCLAVAARPAPREWKTITGKRLLILEGIGNPDNVGGLFRTAHALGADGLLLGPGTGDPFYRKALRVSCGATLAVPFASTDSLAAAVDYLRENGVVVWALTPSADAAPLEEACRDVPDRLALLVGAEGPGLSREVLARASRQVRIPVRPDADSLNVTVAAGIVLAATAVRE
jgi:tRNA G18 (ribose-2'-O)-methylase SpoU